MPTHHHKNQSLHLHPDSQRFRHNKLPYIDAPEIKSLNDMITAPNGSHIDLPDTSRAAWHVSAGMDFSPLVFFSNGYITSHPNTQEISPPSVHIFTCLGGCEKQLRTVLESANQELYSDKKTRICIKSHSLIRLHDATHAPLTEPYPYCHSKKEEDFTQLNAHGFVAEVELQSILSDYRETVQLIYLFSENIKTLTTFVRMELVTIQAIVALNEGLAFGGCNKSIITHIFEHPHYHELRSHGFAPELFVIRSMGQAENSFKQATESGLVQSQFLPVSYLGRDGSVYKAQFSTKNQTHNQPHHQ